MKNYRDLNEFIYALPACDKCEQDDVRCFITQGRAAALNGLIKRAELHGFYSCYVDFDYSSCRQWFYLASRLRAECCKFPNGWSMEFPHSFIFALLSDCESLIKRYGSLDTVAVPHSELPSYRDAVFAPNKYDSRYLSHYIQSIIRKDLDFMVEIEKLVLEKLKNPPKSVLCWFEIGGALRRLDKDSIIAMVNELLNPRTHKAWNEENIAELCGQVWSHHPVMFTKLAWMHGLEIEIDSPLVPMELMPIRPLEHYDDVYDFLKPGYVPVVEKPKKSFLDRVFRR